MGGEGRSTHICMYLKYTLIRSDFEFPSSNQGLVYEEIRR